jgi:hypothetical protein
MRLTRTFVLRMYTDLAVRERTCGVLQALPGRRTHPFKDDTELLGLLRHLAHQGAEASKVSTANQASDPDPPGPGPIVNERPASAAARFTEEPRMATDIHRRRLLLPAFGSRRSFRTDPCTAGQPKGERVHVEHDGRVVELRDARHDAGLQLVDRVHSDVTRGGQGRGDGRMKPVRSIGVLRSLALAVSVALVIPAGPAAAAWRAPGSTASAGAASAAAPGSSAAPGAVVGWGDLTYGATTAPADLSGVTAAISAGYAHSLALRSDGTVVAWGSNYHGQAGVPLDLPGVTAIAAGGYHSLALKSDGAVVAWGYNGNHQTDLPLDVTTGVTAIAGGGWHNLALKSNGTVVAWGEPTYGATSVPDDLSGVTAIAAGRNHSLALTNGSVVAWGWNSDGQATVPADLTGVTAIAAGAWHNLALKSDGTVVAWGSNTYGQTDVPDGLTGVIAIAAGGMHSLALKSDGTIVGWGDNYFGQATSPTDLTGVTAIAAGWSHNLALHPAAIDTTTGVFSSANPSTFGGSVTFTATVSAAAGTPGGSVEFSVDGADLGSPVPLAAGSALISTATLGAGSHSIVATYSGDADFKPSTSPTLTQTVAQATLRKPDGRIRLGASAFVGDNVYNTSGASQSKTGSARKGKTVTFGISIQNDGTAADSFKVKATGSAASKFTVKYYAGTKDITAKVVAGTYRTASLAPGAAVLITAKVTVKTSAAKGSKVTRLVTITSIASTTQKDAVKFIARRS